LRCCAFETLGLKSCDGGLENDMIRAKPMLLDPEWLSCKLEEFDH